MGTDNDRSIRGRAARRDVHDTLDRFAVDLPVAYRWVLVLEHASHAEQAPRERNGG